MTALSAATGNGFVVNATPSDFPSGTILGYGFQVPGITAQVPISSLPLTGVVLVPNLNSVKAVYKRDSDSSPWYLQTMYPD
jgi:hypothetical protein